MIDNVQQSYQMDSEQTASVAVKHSRTPRFLVEPDLKELKEIYVLRG